MGSMMLASSPIVHLVELLEEDGLGRLVSGVLRADKRRDILYREMASWMRRRERRGSHLQRRELRRLSLQHAHVGSAQVA